jgi:outer membrane protein OmpA-like peptidoglycan-associated protein
MDDSASNGLNNLIEMLLDIDANQLDQKKSESNGTLPYPPDKATSPDFYQKNASDNTANGNGSKTHESQPVVKVLEEVKKSDNTTNDSKTHESKPVIKVLEEVKKSDLSPLLSPKAVVSSPNRFQSNQNELRFLFNGLEARVTRLQQKLDEPALLVGSLLPLMAELMANGNAKPSDSLLEEIVPLVDKAIIERTEQDREKMGAAIGTILPDAIAHEIANSPATIAKAIAPELAIAIKEQIQLDPSALAEALGPQMGDAIKNQIVLERDAMVDALYPVIGNTISKYMVEVVKSINDKVESAFSFKGLLRKIRARIQGVSEAELIFKESFNFKIQAVLLIHKASGLVIREVQPAPNFKIEADMWAGMLTAIRNFVNDCTAQPDCDSELHEVEYNASKIIVEVAGYCYLAVVVKGEPSKEFIAKIRETLSQIVIKSDKAIAAFNGDPDTIPKTVDLCIDKLVQAEPKPEEKKKFPIALVVLALIVIGLLAIAYRAYISHQIEVKTAAALDEVPELSVYRVIPEVHWGTLTLSGRLPNQYLTQRAETIVRQVAPDWSIKNQIIAVDVPPDATNAAGEVQRVASIYNQKNGMAIATTHDFGSNNVYVTGVASELKDVEQLSQALRKIPGITSVISTVQIRPVLETRLYFELNSSQLKSPENIAKLRSIRQFLDRNPTVHLKILAYSDPTGESDRNQKLSVERARNTQQALITEGVNPARLQIQASNTSPPDVTSKQPLWLSRSVRFEVFIPSGKK